MGADHKALTWTSRRRVYTTKRATFSRGLLRFELTVVKRAGANSPGGASWELHVIQANVAAKYISLTVHLISAAAAMHAGELFVDALASASTKEAQP
jgi:hypothetical protein